MFGLMVGLVALGVALLFGGRFLARAIVGKDGDPEGTTRVCQVIGALLLIAALFLRPYSDETAAFPPPPDTPIDSLR